MNAFAYICVLNYQQNDNDDLKSEVYCSNEKVKCGFDIKSIFLTIYFFGWTFWSMYQ